MKHFVFILSLLIFAAPEIRAEPIPLVTGEWPPYTSEKLDKKGFATEILVEVFQEMGKEVEITFYPWRRCEEMVKKGKVWATFPYAYTEERHRDYLMSDKMADTNSNFFYYKENKGYQYETLEELKAYKIGGLIGYFYEEPFKEAGLDVNYTYDEVSLIRLLINGKADLAPMNTYVGWYMINTHFPEKAQDFDFIEPALMVGTSHVMASKDYPGAAQLLEEFNAALQRIKDRGVYEDILRKNGLIK